MDKLDVDLDFAFISWLNCSELYFLFFFKSFFLKRRGRRDDRKIVRVTEYSLIHCAETQTKYDLFFQRQFLPDVTFDGIFFFLHGSNITHQKFVFFHVLPSSRLPNRGHKPLCNIYETALITDCFNTHSLPPLSGCSDTVRYRTTNERLVVVLLVWSTVLLPLEERHA